MSFIIINKAIVYYIIYWLASVYRPWSRMYQARFPQMMIIAACLSHTTAVFSLTAMHLTRRFSSRQRDWQGYNETWQNTPAWFLWRETAGHLSDLDELCVLGGADAQRAAQWNQKETKWKSLEQWPCQATGLNIIGKKGMSPELMPPCVHQKHQPLMWCVNFLYV